MVELDKRIAYCIPTSNMVEAYREECFGNGFTIVYGHECVVKAVKSKWQIECTTLPVQDMFHITRKETVPIVPPYYEKLCSLL